tara:strand:+ start:997 stop:1191 length:195 start_codon:yes stop_codon:yes gene_type:complete
MQNYSKLCKNTKSPKMAIFSFFDTKNVTKIGNFGQKPQKNFVHPIFLLYQTIERVMKKNEKMAQ